MVKIIATNAYSGTMVTAEKYTTKVEKISEDEYRENAKKAVSHIGNKGSANRYGLKYNRRPITLQPGDQVYVCYIGGKGILPESGILPHNVHLSFEHIKVIA